MDRKPNILVIGDIMVDHYTYVNTNRTAAEAPIPVWDEVKSEYRLGGAANVANNLLKMGANVSLGGIAAKVYTHGQKVSSVIRGMGIDERFICNGNKTMRKHRFVDNETKKIIFRSDNIKRFPQAEIDDFEEHISDSWVSDDVRDMNWDAIVISDYDKGTITPVVVEVIHAMKVCPAVVVDSKRNDLSIFEGFDVLKVNAEEYNRQIAHPVYINVERLFKYVVVTQGAAGAELRMNDVVKTSGNRYLTHVEHFLVDKVEAVDVTGCGDTHTAAMAFALANDPNDMRAAVRYANKCASTVVQKFGTSVV